MGSCWGHEIYICRNRTHTKTIRDIVFDDFACYWPLWNLYWSIFTIFYALAGTNPNVKIFVYPALFMLFLLPILAFAFLGVSHLVSYLATPLAVVSLRPAPIILCVVAWLEHKDYIPDGHLWPPIQSPGKYLIGNQDGNWTYPLLYSILTILCGISFIIRQRKTSYTSSGQSKIIKNK
jgi:hypothetical protein